MKKIRVVQELLQAYATAYPILLESERVLHKPIAVVVESVEEGIAFAKTLSCKPVLIDRVWSLHAVAEEVICANSDAIVWIHPPQKKLSAKSDEIVHLLCSAAAINQIGREPCSAAVFMLFPMIVPEELRGHVFEVHIDENAKDYSAFSIEDVVPNEEELLAVLANLRNTTCPFEAASKFIKRDDDLTEEEWTNFLMNIVKELKVQADEFSKEDQLRNTVLDELVSYFAEQKVKVVEIVEGEIEDPFDVNNCCFIEENILYVKEKIFCKGVSSLSDQVRIETIKKRLLQEGALQADIGGYTVQKWLKPSNGKPVRKRLMAIDLTGYNKLPSL